jgi:serine/threonine-protein kinase
MSSPFDPVALAVTGPEAPVLDGVMMCSLSASAVQFAPTRAGSLFFVPGADQARTRLVWVDRQGRVTPTAATPDLFGTVKVSPDGRRALVEVGGVQNDVYVYDLQDGRRIRMTSDGKGGRRGLWHPDGRVIYYSEGDHHWVIKPVEGDATPQPLPSLDGFFTAWSATGVLAGERDGRIWTGTLDHQTPITAAGSEWGATVSPDGRLVAYTSARTGNYQVFAQPNPPTGREWPVSSDFGEEPIWSRDSKELFYRRHGEWWGVAFTKEGPAPPRLLFRGDFVNPFGPSYDVAPDGRFLMAQPPSTGASRELQWIQNWTTELHR